MKHLWGLKAIAAHVGWKDPRAPLRAMQKEGFLMLRRRKGGHPRTLWYSNSDLVKAWMISKAQMDREWLLERDKQKGNGDEGA